MAKEHDEQEEGECTPTKTETPIVTEDDNVPKVKRIRLSINRKFVGCVPVSDFSIKEKVGEGTFGEVYRAVHIKSGKEVALKKVLSRAEQEGFPITAVREIKLLKHLHHANVIDLQEMVFEQDTETGNIPGIYMSFSYMEHDLTGLLQDKDIRFTLPQIKCYMSQILHGLKYLHDHQILHRDIKGSNILLNNRGELRVTDFGLSRPMEDGRKEYTPGVYSRWYRPPELLLGSREYDSSADMWGVGCILAEMFLKRPLFPGEDDFSQLEVISKLCGTPSSETIPNFTTYPMASKVHIAVYKRKLKDITEIGDVLARDLIDKLLVLDAKKRLSAKTALDHAFFSTPPLAALPQSLPTYSSRHEYTDTKMSLAHAPHPTPQEHALIPPLLSAGRVEDPWKPILSSNAIAVDSDSKPNGSERRKSVEEGRRTLRDDSYVPARTQYPLEVRRTSKDYHYSAARNDDYYARDSRSREMDRHHHHSREYREEYRRADHYHRDRPEGHSHSRGADGHSPSRSPRRHTSRYDSGYRRKQTDYRDL